MIHYLMPAKAQGRAHARDWALCRGRGVLTTELMRVDCPDCLRKMGDPEYIRAVKFNNGVQR